MNPLLLLGLIGAALAFTPKRASAKERVIREAKEIVDGQRDSFTDVPAPPSDDEADDARIAAEQAAALAAADLESSNLTPTPSGSAIPLGYDPEGARRMVSSIVNNLKNKGQRGYDRQLLKSFQSKAGIAADRVYGGATRGALLFYGANDPPAPFRPPLQTIPYRAPA